MGKYDSSLARVQPIFNALYDKDPSGESWVSQFLQLGPQPTKATFSDTIQLSRQPVFELSANPPKSFLKWLITHPERLTNPNYRCSPRTMEKREALIAGDRAVLSEALQAIDGCNKIPLQVWWRLEGVSKIDCALFAEDTIIVIEGKRTELGASKNIAWYPKRNQVLRNLDCAAEYASKHGLQNFYVMLVVEKRLTEHDPVRQEEIQGIMLNETIKASLPHLSHEQREELMTHYLGVTFWEDIVDYFCLDSSVLINSI